MFSSKSRKLDLSFITYLSDKDIKDPKVTYDEIKRRFPFLKSNLETFRMYLILNHEHLSQEEIVELQKTIAYLQDNENQKFISAIEYIEKCQQQPKQDSTQN